MREDKRKQDRRLVRSPNLLLCDTGLISSLQVLSAERLATDPVLVGPLLENFVAMELQKQSAWSLTQPRLFHFHTQTGQEVGVVLGDAAGRVVGIEVNSSATVGACDFKGLHARRRRPATASGAASYSTRAGPPYPSARTSTPRR